MIYGCNCYIHFGDGFYCGLCHMSHVYDKYVQMTLGMVTYYVHQFVHLFAYHCQTSPEMGSPQLVAAPAFLPNCSRPRGENTQDQTEQLAPCKLRFCSLFFGHQTDFWEAVRSCVASKASTRASCLCLVQWGKNDWE